MILDRYKRQAQKAASTVQHLGRAVRGARAFFVFCDRNDPAQPQMIACHPPLSDTALLRCLGPGQVVFEPICQDDSHHAFVGVASDSQFDNEELASEMTSVAAASLARLYAGSESIDPTTGLPDRDEFVAHVAANPDAAGGIRPTIVAIDVDHCHRVIATFGEPGGEELMRVLAHRLTDAMGADLLVARIGPNRFGILVCEDSPSASESRALKVAAVVHELCRHPVRIAHEDIFVTVSVGIVPGDETSGASAALHEAALVLALAKASGGATTRTFRAGMNNAPAFQLLRERDVRLGVARDQFTVSFQPIVGAVEEELHAFEALLRWQHPEEGLLPPSTFLDVLLETGLIDQVGRSVIRRSCEHAARWFALSGSIVPVSVNIAPVQLRAADFCDYVSRALAETRLPPQGLILELTEHALIDDALAVRGTLVALRKLGIRVVIDDFGTGYSSLSYLHQLPVSGIKLDRQWFHSIDESASQREIVRTIVSLAHFMGMTVVAEGIESATQLKAARDLDCDFAQGFRFSHPLEPEQATRYLVRNLSRSVAA